MSDQAQEQREIPDQPDDRPDDREDDTDRAIKLARTHVIASVKFLAMVLNDGAVGTDDRVKAATTLLEVAGCL